jgi:hypothetical protein
MNDSSNSRASRIPSDDQMDGLLRDFFATEVPLALNQRFRRQAVSQAASPELATSLTIVADNDPIFHCRPRGGRLVVGSAIAVLAMSTMLAVINRPSVSSSSSVTTAPAAEATASPAEALMLVSPNGDLKEASHPIGEDGVTLEETDSIELNPK